MVGAEPPGRRRLRGDLAARSGDTHLPHDRAHFVGGEMEIRRAADADLDTPVRRL